MSEPTQEDIDAREAREEVLRRRLLRKEQRFLQEEVENNRVQLNQVDSGAFQETRGRLNDQFIHVNHPREQQNDVTVFKTLSLSAKAQSGNLSDSATYFNSDFAFQTIQEKFRGRGDAFSWNKLGDELACIATCASRVETMVGPMAKEAKVRKVTVRNARDPNMAALTAERPEEIEQGEEDADEATNERLKVLHDLIVSSTLPTDGQQPTLDLLKLLVDPADNVQTVENFFDFSFLIKDKRVMQDMDADTHMPVTVGCDEAKLMGVNGEALSNAKCQMIVSINMRDLTEFRSLLHPEYQAGASQVTSSASSSGSAPPHPLHRVDPLYDAADAREQADLIQQRNRVKQEERQARQKAARNSSAAAPSASAQGKGRAGSSSQARLSFDAPASQSQRKGAQLQQSTQSMASSSSSGGRLAREVEQRASPQFTASPDEPAPERRRPGPIDTAGGEEDCAVQSEESPTTTSSTRSSGGKELENTTPPHLNLMGQAAAGKRSGPAHASPLKADVAAGLTEGKRQRL